MCDNCENLPTPGAVHRRHFLKFAGAALAGAALTSNRIFAAESSAAPPKPQNVLNPDQALERLMAGNRRYVEGIAKKHDFVAERESLTRGQNPFAGILSCADSRVVPEYTFDTGRADLFVVRIAGNFAEDEAIASFEYDVQFLGTTLLMVLGHQSCGAVEATIKSIKDGVKLPGHIPVLAKHIAPAVKYAMSHPSTDLLNDAIRENVVLNVEKLKTATPILSRMVEQKKVRVVGGVYSLDTGHVELVA